VGRAQRVASEGIGRGIVLAGGRLGDGVAANDAVRVLAQGLLSEGV